MDIEKDWKVNFGLNFELTHVLEKDKIMLEIKYCKLIKLEISYISWFTHKSQTLILKPQGKKHKSQTYMTQIQDYNK